MRDRLYHIIDTAISEHYLYLTKEEALKYKQAGMRIKLLSKRQEEKAIKEINKK